MLVLGDSVLELASLIIDFLDPKYRKQRLMTVIGNSIIRKISVTDLNRSGVTMI